MKPLVLLKLIGKALVRQVGNAVGLGVAGDILVGVGEDVWKDWSKEQDADQRRQELEAVARLAADDVRAQVEAVVREVAAGQPEAVRTQVSAALLQVPDRVRQSFRRPEDRQGVSAPPGFRVMKSHDLATMLSAPVAVPPTPPAAARVVLEFTHGAKAGEAIECTEPAVLLLGRGEDCNPRFPHPGHERISRRHCLVEVNPPDVRVRDFGSLRGTFVNGELIGKRPTGTEPDGKFVSAERDLADGAVVELTDKGQVAFRVRVHRPPPSAAKPVVKRCGWCQREVAAERGADRPGLFVCPDCRGNVQGMMRELLGQAQAGKPELTAVREYDLVEELGHGGMGAVHLARHRRTGEAVAIKVMLPQVAADDRAVELFQREVRNTMALRHRHVVKLLDHGFWKGTFFMVLEYCDGGSADGLMRQRGGPLPVDEAAEIALQALEGLHHAHTAEVPNVRQKGGGYAPGRGLVHRDIKPANLFLSGWGSGRVVKVGDYGLAKAFEEVGLTGGTRTGEAAGTWQFMARRQVAGYRDAGPEVDVWSLAASLYYLLTGHTPRDFPADQDPWLAVLENAPVPIAKRGRPVPPRLAGVIDAALREEPAMPFRTAAELRQALEDAL